MVIAKRYTWTSLLIVLFTTSALGCASSGGPKAGSEQSAPAGSRVDMSALAGRWIGDIIFPNGTSSVATWELTPAGDYTTQSGAFTATGKATVKDGHLVLTNTSTTGGMTTAPRTGMAWLSQRSDGTLVLTGNGHSDSGPFNFVITRQ